MDIIPIILLVMVMGMGLMTFFQYRSLKAKKMLGMMPPRMMPQEPNPYGAQIQPNTNPEYIQQIQKSQQPAQSAQIQAIRQQNINSVANKNYRQVYGDLAREMQEKKYTNVTAKQAEILQQKNIYEMMKGAKHGKEFGRSVDVQSWERKNLYAINENKQPMEKVEFLEPKVEQQQYWAQNMGLVWGILGFSGFILFLVLVM